MSKLIDISGNQNHGTIVGALRTKDGMKFDGVDDKMLASNEEIANSQNYTVISRIKIPSHQAFERIIAIDTFKNGILYMKQPGSISVAQASDTEDMIINIPYNQYITVAFGASSGVTFLNVNGIYGQLSGASPGTGVVVPINSICYGDDDSGTRYSKFEIVDSRVYNRALSADEIKAYHNSFIKPVLIEDFSNYAVGDTL